MGEVHVTVTEGVAGPVESVIADGEQLLEHLGHGEGELSVVLCDDGFIRPLNARWRGNDAPTDVLSFSQVEGEAIGQQGPLGDVVISVETARRQAARLGHAFEQEIRVLLVHGVLHLLGHDHGDPDERATMRAREVELLGALGADAEALLARGG